MSAQVRRNGWLQRKRNPSAICVRRRAGSIARSSWNGVRISASETNENAYETASKRNGTARPSPKSAPPSGGPASITSRRRASDDAHGRGQLPRRDDGAQRAGWAVLRQTEPVPSTNATTAICQNATRSRDRRGRGRDREGADGVGGDHQPLAVPAVGGDARRQAEHGVRKEPGETHDTRLRRRARDREHQQRIRDRGDRRTERREQPPGQQKHEVPVPPQRAGEINARRAAGVPRGRRSLGNGPTAVQPPSTKKSWP